MMLRRHGLRRVAIIRRPPARPKVDMAALKRTVVERDGECVAHKLGFLHECRDVIGNPHAPDATHRLSLEHVKTELRIAKRADDDPAHTVALCYSLNLQPPTKEMRAAFRMYLRSVA